MSASLQREALCSLLPGGRSAAGQRAIAAQQRMLHARLQSRGQPHSTPQQQHLPAAGQASGACVGLALLLDGPQAEWFHL